MSRTFHLFLVILAALGLTALFLIVLPAQQRTLASTQAAITVNTLQDEDYTDGDCSLREAIRAANENMEVDNCPAGDVISDTILFAFSGRIVLNAQLDVTIGGPLLIDGGGAITISGEGRVRIFSINTGAVLTLERLLLVNGYAEEAGGISNKGSLIVRNSTLLSNIADENGGGINNDGTLNITGSNLIDNRAYHGVGGGINNGGALTVSNSTLAENSANSGGGISNGGINGLGTLNIAYSTLDANRSYRDGGGIINQGKMILTNTTLFENHSDLGVGGGISNVGTLTITNGTLSYNSAGINGGGISNEGTLTIIIGTLSHNSAGYYGGGISNGGVLGISNSTLSGNGSNWGGGISNEGTLTIISSTLSGNESEGDKGINGEGGAILNRGVLIITNSTLSRNISDGSGGGISNGGTLTIINSTLFGNNAFDGGGISGYGTVSNSIIAFNGSGGNCMEAISDSGHNIEDTDTCGFDPANSSMPNTDPLLGPLQDNLGPTQTHALLDGSPAIDTGDPVSCPATDQRGVPRPFDGDGDGTAICDIGSYETAPFSSLYLPIVSSIG